MKTKTELKHTPGPWKQSKPLFPLKSGKKVRIFNRTMGGELFLEGVAVLVSKVPVFGGTDDYTAWMVCFQGDETPYRRNIYLPVDFDPKEIKAAIAKAEGR